MSRECPKCHVMIYVTTFNYCTRDGAKLEPPNLCTTCNFAIDLYDNFCGSCGVKQR